MRVLRRQVVFVLIGLVLLWPGSLAAQQTPGAD